MSIMFEITTKSGEIHKGHVMGSGGYLGAGTAFQGRDRERAAAVRQLTNLIAFCSRTGELPTGIAREPGGMCIVHPPYYYSFVRFEDYAAAIKTVPLDGATFRILS